MTKGIIAKKEGWFSFFLKKTIKRNMIAENNTTNMNCSISLIITIKTNNPTIK